MTRTMKMSPTLRRAALLAAMSGFALTAVLLPAQAQTVHTESRIDGMDFGPLQKLPKGPGLEVADGDFCARLVIKPASAAGKFIAGRGWHVTSEAVIGRYEVVSFAGKFEEGTSGSCHISEGNVGVFVGTQLVALVYASKGSEKTIGKVVPLEGGGLRVWDGDYVSQPVGDIQMPNPTLLQLTALADKQLFCSGKASVPNIYSMPIDKARAKLAAAGWTPVPGNIATDGSAAREEGLAKQGIVEVDGCAGTGFAYCSFNYRGAGGTLAVTTVGEDDLPGVSGYEVTCP
jgi:hypothetical protein